MRVPRSLLAMAAILAVAATPAKAANFSFTGSLSRDDQVLLFNFNVGATSTVTLETLSYAGGTNAAGTVIPRGGFDPILALFNASGNLIGQNDDGGGNVPRDSVTGVHFDTFLQTLLDPGSYTVSVMEYNDFALGPNLSNGFSRSGSGNFTTAFGCPDAQPAFNDVTGVAGCGRTAAWAFDVLNVNSAELVGAPEPTTLAMLSSALFGISLMRRRR